MVVSQPWDGFPPNRTDGSWHWLGSSMNEDGFPARWREDTGGWESVDYSTIGAEECDAEGVFYIGPVDPPGRLKRVLSAVAQNPLELAEALCRADGVDPSGIMSQDGSPFVRAWKHWLPEACEIIGCEVPKDV